MASLTVFRRTDIIVESTGAFIHKEVNRCQQVGISFKHVSFNTPLRVNFHFKPFGINTPSCISFDKYYNIQMGQARAVAKWSVELGVLAKPVTEVLIGK